MMPRLVAHVLLVERPGGLLLVDTGIGTDDLADPARLGGPFLAMMRPTLSPAETAIAQLTALGFTADDVTDIALTHLDLDHAGGLSDFPDARVHVNELEYDAATRPRRNERARYVAGQWAHGPRWVMHADPGEDWLGFPAVTALADDVLMIPLLGHTRGHAGIAVRQDDGGWLLHAGDSFFDARQVRTPPTCHRGLAVLQRMFAVDNKARLHNTERLRELVAARSAEVTVVCSHDSVQFESFAGATPD